MGRHTIEKYSFPHQVMGKFKKTKLIFIEGEKTGSSTQNDLPSVLIQIRVVMKPRPLKEPLA
jgi:hypothetical protein